MALRRSAQVQIKQQGPLPEASTALPESNEDSSKHEATPEAQQLKVSSGPKTTESEPQPASVSQDISLPPNVAVKPDRRVRGRRGLLNFMTEMPLDTLHEIFLQLEPVDLLHVSWSSKSLHSIVMGRNARYIWEEAYERVYQYPTPPPRCPDDLNLAQYTKFLFEKDCMVRRSLFQLCGSVHGYYTSWMMRLRACWNCLRSDRYLPPFPDAIRHISIFFSSSFKSCSPHEVYVLTIRAKKAYFCFSDDIGLQIEMTGDYVLINERSAFIQAREKHWGRFGEWKAHQSNKREEELDQRRRERQVAILEKLSGLGWTENRLRAVTGGKMNLLPSFKKAKKLTSGEWKELQPAFEEKLQKIYNEYVNSVGDPKLSERWRAFKSRFNEWAQTQTLDSCLMPHVADIALLDPFKSIIFTPTTPDESVVFDLDEIDRVAKAWMISRQDFVLSLLPQDICNFPSNEERTARLSDLIPLACLVFKGPSVWADEFPTLQRILTHRFGVFASLPIEDESIRCAMRQLCCERPWDWDHRKLKFDAQIFDKGRDIVKLFGLEPMQATEAQINAKEAEALFQNRRHRNKILFRLDVLQQRIDHICRGAELDEDERPFPEDIAVIEPFRSTIFRDIDDEPACLFMDDLQFAHIVLGWHYERKRYILSLLPEELVQDRGGNKVEDPLSLEVAYFCRNGSTAVQFYYQAICRIRESFGDLPIDAPREVLLLGLGQFRRPWQWDRYKWTFDLDRYRATTTMMIFLEMDPRLTKPGDFLSSCATVKLQCVQCKAEEDGGLRNCWSAVQHELEYHRDNLFLPGELKWRVA
ncbi:hypothetical protein AN958_00770 [Leucoagaricus sp. SymC.cos]|nr:hypothetical protein AN958_00770 [Leucoagaricus sp. SymC.cos]